MTVIHTLLIAVQILSALGIIGLVLLQQGKGADMGASFGGGASGSLFGATGSANFLSRSTAVCATVFFAATLGLALLSNKAPSGGASVLQGAAPAASAPVGVASGAQAIPGIAPAPATPASLAVAPATTVVPASASVPLPSASVPGNK
jgi:preprotein translocase subunit SecG